jgi:uncharacterized protein (UPF0332 family)
MDERINDPKFINCLKKNKIRKFSQGKSLVKKELASARNDLSEAEESLGRKRFKWATIQAYYSMFHSARAFLYNNNYREKSHYCLIVALEYFYVREGKLSSRLVEGLQRGKNLRENADYYDQWSKTGAEETIKLAKEFIESANQIIG